MIPEVAADQHGIITRRQARAAGLTDEYLRAQVEAGRWQRVMVSVYAVFTGQLPRLSWLWAVVLRAGRDAVLSHETAAELNGLIRQPRDPVHITVPAGRHIASIPDVVVHRAQVVPRPQPARDPPRTRIDDTVIDLTQTARNLDSAIGWLARAIPLTTAQRLLETLAGRRRVRWRARLTEALIDIGDGSRSVLELRYLQAVHRAHGLPPIKRQAPRDRRGGRFYDDIVYLEFGVIVELDGRAAHPDSERWRDMRRDNAAAESGLTVLRYGWTDVDRDPCGVAAQVAQVLRLRGWPAPLLRCPRCPTQDCGGLSVPEPSVSHGMG